MTIERVVTPCDLTIHSFRAQCELLEAETGEMATTLGIEKTDMAAACEVLKATHRKTLEIVIVPNMPKWHWFVCNRKGIRWSPGA